MLGFSFTVFFFPRKQFETISTKQKKSKPSCHNSDMCITTTDIDANANAKLMLWMLITTSKCAYIYFRMVVFISTLEIQTIIKRADISIRRAWRCQQFSILHVNARILRIGNDNIIASRFVDACVVCVCVFIFCLFAEWSQKEFDL